MIPSEVSLGVFSYEIAIRVKRVRLSYAGLVIADVSELIARRSGPKTWRVEMCSPVLVPLLRRTSAHPKVACPARGSPESFTMLELQHVSGRVVGVLLPVQARELRCIILISCAMKAGIKSVS